MFCARKHYRPSALPRWITEAPLHYIVGSAAVNVFLVLAIGVRAIVAIFIALQFDCVGRIERKVAPRRDVGRDLFLVGG
jgi:hypothetical protein